ncbi:MAG: Gfo/Idh/MocA family oxidoreductase [Acidobacteria bacterium]|nr:Gfo/Idh/MocA family oxidoreductase [Acidobacteriota bacterium]MBI3278337.1 Gfo/Idh/MocA family oxidoreductase [Acidobacteriota bacterium]
MRIAVLGLGFMGSTHLKAWRSVPGATLAAVYSKDEQKLTGDLSGIQGNLGGPGEKFDFSNVRKYREIAELLRDRDVDAVDICLPTDLHAPTTVEALRAGKHVLVEKPMALDGASADRMLVEAEQSGRILMAAQVLRFFPAYSALAGALASGKFGRVRSALFRRRCAAPFWSKWLNEAEKSGGGVFDLLIHDVDFCVKLFGIPEAVSATGYEAMAEGVDFILATLHYRDVPSVVITGGWHHQKAFPFNMEYTVISDGATFDYNFQRENATVYTAEGESHPLEMPEVDGFEAELAYFAECCRKGKSPELCPPSESATAVKLALQMVEARKQNGEKVPCQV